MADICTLEFKLKQLTDAFVVDPAGTKSGTLDEVEARYGDWSLQHDRFMLHVGHPLQQLEDWADTVAGGGCSVSRGQRLGIP